MTRNDIVLDQLVELINHHGGIDAIGQAVGVLMNHAMAIERADAIGAQPYQRTERPTPTGYRHGEATGEDGPPSARFFSRSRGRQQEGGHKCPAYQLS